MNDLQTKWGNTLPQNGDYIYCEGKAKKLRTGIAFRDYPGSGFDPIPLTPKVMERIGEADHVHSLVWEITDEGGEIEIQFPMKKSFVFLNNSHAKSITHLHHLQQLYRLLTGNELTIDWE